MGTKVKVGPKYQVVIPLEVRKKVQIFLSISPQR